MKKRNIFFDFDGFMFETLNAHIGYMNETYSINTTAEDYKDHPSLEMVVKRHRPDGPWPTREEVYEHSAKYLLESKKWHNQMTPMPGMLEVLPILSENFCIHIVTARHSGSGKMVEYLLQKYDIAQHFSSANFVWKHLGGQKFEGDPKRDIIQRIGNGVAFFDDSVNEVKKTADVVPAYLYDPHNNHADKSDIQNRFTDLRQIPEIVAELVA